MATPATAAMTMPAMAPADMLEEEEEEVRVDGRPVRKQEREEEEGRGGEGEEPMREEG